jgi:nucleotide-binding universal stress UspA family protein
MKIVLAPVDFSDVSGAVVQFAADVAKAFQTSLYLLHVAPPDPYFVGYEPGPQTVRDNVAQKIHQGQRRLQELEAEMKSKGYDVHALLVQGATTDKILQEAKRLEASMIVVGSHGHGALHTLLVGSVAEGLLRKSQCPVLIVPSTKKV